MTAGSEVGTSTKGPSARRIIAAACIGNALEWYDIAVYAYFASYIAKVFFTSADETLSLLLALGTFAISFLIRPLGAFLLGSYADRAGRKPALSLSIGLMVVGTLLICVMPPHAVIGVAAPIGILVARLIQGFAAGGEFGSANLGVWARDEAGWPWLAHTLTTGRLRELLPETADLPVVRHVLPNLRALNFVVDGLLGEGALSQARFDPQAKALGEWLRARHLDIPEELLP